MSLILIGYRGSGKTTLGRRLADALKWPFVDLDEQLVAREGKTIRQIFQDEGEPAFRQLETQHLREAMLLRDHVISLGGGAVLAEENRQAISGSGHLVVYLRADADELHRRIVADSTTAEQRPQLTHLGGSIDEVRSLLAVREPIYRQVKNIELEVSTATIDELVQQLVQHVRQ